jgi:release factor glutamine methyltransferase
MHLVELLNQLQATFSRNGVESARLAAELLVSHGLSIRRLELPLHARREVSAAEEALLRQRATRVSSGEPIQYVLGHVDFIGRLFAVDRRVLIPRPETEELVEAVSRCIREHFSSAKTLRGIDVGTGSGCIAVSLACLHRDWQWVAVDCSADALDVARENAAAYKASDRIEFVQADLLRGFEPSCAEVVVANLPYIQTEVCAELSPVVRDYEPLTALDGGRDGLVLIRRLIDQAYVCLNEMGCIFLEIGYDQGPEAHILLCDAGFTNVRLLKDLAGHDRIVTGIKKVL